MTDSTNETFDDSLVDWSPADHDETGYPDGLAANDTSDRMAGLQGVRDFPSWLWIEPRDWKEAARQNDKYNTWAESRREHFTNQSPTHECVCHSFAMAMCLIWLKQSGGAAKAIWFSPLSVYAEANPRRWGGTYLQKVLSIGIDRGILPEHHGPEGLNSQREEYTHTLNCSSGNVEPWGGPWVPIDRFPNGWRETAKHFRPLEVCNPRSWEEIICLLLHGYTVCVGRKGHAVPYTQVVWRDGKLYALYPDSYEVIRYDSQRMIQGAVGGAYAIMTMTVPDDWSRPAG